MSYMTLCLWVNSMGYNKVRKYKNLSVNSHLTPNYTNLESDFLARKLKYFLRGFHRGIKDFSSSMSIIINIILLTVVYLIGIGVTSLFAKLVRKHFLDLKIKKEAHTYWSDLNLTRRPNEEYYRQF